MCIRDSIYNAHNISHICTCTYTPLAVFNVYYCDVRKKKKLSHQDDDDFQPLKPVNTTPARPRKKQPDSIDKMLTKKDLSYLAKEGNRLQDVHMAVAGVLLKKQFPAKAGFQPTVYDSERLQPQGEGTIQFHFDSQRQHWTTSTFSGGTIRYFDSLYPDVLSDEMQCQLRALYGHLMKNPKVLVMRVQQQQGTVDCSLFAIAYAVSLANGKDPAKTKFVQQSMRAFFTDASRRDILGYFLPIRK